MYEEFKNKIGHTLAFMDDGIWVLTFASRGRFFPYGSIQKIGISLGCINIDAIQGKEYRAVFAFSKEQKPRVKELVDFAQSKMKTAPREDVLDTGYDQALEKMNTMKHAGQDKKSDFATENDRKIISMARNRDFFGCREKFRKELSAFPVSEQPLFAFYSAVGEMLTLVITPTMICPAGLLDATPIPAKNGLQSTPYKLSPHGLQFTFTDTRKKSVGGSAVAGGILAGGVGAVVGAICTASANASGGVTKEYSSNNIYYNFTIKSPANGIDHEIGRIDVFPEAIKRFGKLESKFKDHAGKDVYIPSLKEVDEQMKWYKAPYHMYHVLAEEKAEREAVCGVSYRFEADQYSHYKCTHEQALYVINYIERVLKEYH